MSQKNIMIIGGEFNNKGAQAMSFITISRLKELFPQHEILFVSEVDIYRDPKDLVNYNFKIIHNPFLRNNFFGETILRKLLKKNQRINPKEYKKYLPNTEYIFDISGYALSSQWGEEKSLQYLKRCEISSNYGIKTVILPQSIGPFNYTSEKIDWKEKLSQTLNKVNLIFPREEQGRQALEDVNVIDNVIQCYDLVLTSRAAINWSSIYHNIPEDREFTIASKSVAIIPNMRNFDHSNKDELLEVYNTIVNELIKKGKNIYLIRHSGEDIEACHLIKDLFKYNDSVKIISEDMTPSEFEKLIQQFDYAIASRFHSVVHSYKEKVPCLILGWAIKYQELAKLFDQSQYVLDVRNDINLKEIKNCISELDQNCFEESVKIKNVLNDVKQLPDPFELLKEKI
ncbi:polysaccharide pyruvyl transferase family protein [Enterococcus casseliflavus]|uniref:polysaccharide pyruvyl transferase family protein n=2 Tax=Enterococcus sp. 6D12_DIV0197 TaxID=1834184 RepID=UPI000B3E9D6B|nr:polysaccharide pyruvyl transferase family protein [Enterococcus sp. 6D12_DIV0197]MBF0009978.1 polysaccharide pyruvyl transferase family protein [Enterococcus casseliflavus]OUZ23686.1 hypothetical protein A5867_001371 [Enterococcus sp. 6D12_DIV0197]